MPISDALSARWLPLREAALILGESPITLRRRCASNARVVDDVQEARFDGLVARRLGGTWRIWLAAGWADPNAPTREDAVLPLLNGSARRGGRTPT